MTTYLEQLNEQQRAAVEYLDGPELVIAGAGSGKTRVLTYKIVHLLTKGYEPWRIMALTFTNKAADEMKERIISLAGASSGSKITMGTFHSVFSRILRANAQRIGYSSSYTIYDASDSLNLVKTIIRDMGLDEKVYKPSSVANEISNAKNRLILPGDYIGDPQISRDNAHRDMPLLGQIYVGYCQRCRVAQAMDFDDLLLNTNILLRDNPDVRRHYQEFYRYILVDEYQDTNFAQHMIVRQLTEDGRNLCVVGDDAQSIYSFRGANIRNILGLERSFPKLATFKLEQNYRSTENIINAAGSLIAKNVEQIPKNVFSKNGAGKPVEVIRSYSDYEESYLVASRISQMKVQTGSPYSEFAVLYRTNAQSRVLEESLRKRNIPYRIYGGQSFYQRKEVKDTTSFFRLAINPHDDEALRRVINVPARGIGETTVKKLTAAALAKNISLWTVLGDPLSFDVQVNRGTLAKLAAFREMTETFVRKVEEGNNAYEVAKVIISTTGLIAQFRSETTPENISRAQNVEELLNSAASFVEECREQGLEGEDTMPAFMAQVSLASDVESEEGDNAGDCVTLMTIHSAKGLEFDNVFVVGVEEDLLPSSMSSDSPQAVEEERRLLYVAITRARHYCMLSYASSRFRNGMTALASPSRFLADIDSRYLKFVAGSNIDGFHSPVPDDTPYQDRWDGRGNRTSYGRSPFGRGRLAKGHTDVPGERRRSYDGPRNYADVPYVTPSPAPLSSGATADLHNVSELSVGMTIEHNRFGRGIITSIDADNPQGDRIVVNFDNVNIRTLLLKFARFAILDK